MPYNMGKFDLIDCMGWIPLNDTSSDHNERWVKNPTVVYSNWDRGELVDSDVLAKFFEQNKLQIMVTGHQPHGDSPLCIRLNSESFVISADTSYSGDVKWLKESESNVGKASLSFRGQESVSELLIAINEDCGSVNEVVTHGVLSNGMKYMSTNLLEEDSIGTFVRPKGISQSCFDWWNQFRLQDDGRYLVSFTEGYNVTNALVDAVEKRKEVTQ